MTVTERRISYTEFPSQSANFLEDVLNGLKAAKKHCHLSTFMTKKVLSFLKK